jgi:hypothetical protein
MNVKPIANDEARLRFTLPSVRHASNNEVEWMVLRPIGTAIHGLVFPDDRRVCVPCQPLVAKRVGDTGSSRTVEVR